MSRPWRVAPALWNAAAILAVVWAAVGCGSDGGTKPSDDAPLPGEVLPDFALQDVNPKSATHGMTISPRAYLGAITGWFFGPGST